MAASVYGFAFPQRLEFFGDNFCNIMLELLVQFFRVAAVVLLRVRMVWACVGY
jgi:dsRNA-specific ribonuclease